MPTRLAGLLVILGASIAGCDGLGSKVHPAGDFGTKDDVLVQEAGGSSSANASAGTGDSSARITDTLVGTPTGTAVHSSGSNPTLRDASVFDEDAGYSSSTQTNEVHQPLPARPSDVNDCGVVYLGDWYRCQPGTELNRYQTRSECAQACLEDPSCSAITDYTWLGVPANDWAYCITYKLSGPCEPTQELWHEEDKGRGYGVLCGSDRTADTQSTLSDLPGLVADESSICRFLYLGDSNACEGDVPWSQAKVTYNSLQECLQACEANEKCAGVKDSWDPSFDYPFECALHFGTCDAPVDGEFTDSFYKKDCDF